MNLLKPSKIIITGCTGFIGASAARYLSQADIQIFGIKRKGSDDWRLSKLRNKIELIECNLSNPTELTELFKKIIPNYVFHCAEPKGFPQNHTEYLDKNNESIKMLSNLLEVSKSSSIKKFIHCGSSLVYNQSLVKFQEKLPLEPSNWRGLIKLNEDNLVRFYYNNYNLPINTVRILRAYGPGEQFDRLIYTVTDALMNNKPVSLTHSRHKRDYIFVDDLIELMMLMAMNASSGIIVNAGSGQSYSAIDIARKISDIMETPLQINNDELFKPGDRGVISCDISNAKKYGWSPKTTIDEGLSKTVKWYVENKSNRWI